ncbi:MAG: mechanosensitive ion channel [Bacteroidales bacterium]|nr:mechanosensitive ion channel [Bacteroidales bacterium]
MIERWINWYNELLTGTGLSDGMVLFIENTTIILITIILAILADVIVKRIIIIFIARLAKRSKNEWDDVFVKRRVFNRLAHLAPALIVYSALQYIFDATGLVSFLENLTQAYMILLVLLVIDSLLNALHEIYSMLPISKGRNIKGFIQVVKIIFYFVAIIMIIAIFSGETPKTLMAGLGAMAAVLMLVFKDTILGFVASIQLSANKMVNVGDWISMPKYNADGDVIDISLNTVKVQNWDKTIATIPTYALVSESFNNWKGMEESGGRRIKRSISIDMNSVTFLDDAQIEKLGNFNLLKDYINNKQKEIVEYNKSLKLEEGIVTNGRKMTNLGVFRKYLEEYLQHHPMISKEMTFLVRHLQPTDKGLPVEIYVFSNDQAWANYEAIQADILDHTLAILPEFDLRIFQNPTGSDFHKLTE